MVELSENARKGLDDYLRQVRSYLRWSRSLDRNEVEQNIAEHIERELEGAPEPVSPSARLLTQRDLQFDARKKIYAETTSGAISMPAAADFEAGG